MYKDIFFLSGLPRSGSTLLLNILLQNPEFYSEGNSALCQLMWDAKVSCQTNSYEQLSTSNKLWFEKNYLQKIPNIYYPVDGKYIIDKCRSWTLPDNYKLIVDNINSDPKIIVLTRNIKEIVKSFIRVRSMFNVSSQYEVERLILNPGAGGEPLIRSLYGCINAKNNYSNILFIDYEEIVNNTDEVISNIYEYLGIDRYLHNISYIEEILHEDDSIFNENVHSIRNKIEKLDNSITLSDWAHEKCAELNKILYA